MGTWEITDLPSSVNTVDARWVLKIKTDANLVLMKFKARLVVRGFTQKEGINYTEIFALVAPIQPIRGVLAFTAVQDWEVDSIDVKQAYLNLNLHHDIYLKPPIRMKIPPGKIRFHCMPSAPCLYTRGMGSRITVITAYVDDMLIASPSCEEVDHTKGEIMSKWGTEDNRQIKEFLSIKIIQNQNQRSLSLDLMAYVKAMVNKWLEWMTEKSWVPMQSIAGGAKGDKCLPQ
ncbi:uncharacterized protein UBRO_20989 [Ustilago bromivora]|uniref:Reverse transcriptase Ty1/copia-type domain-containing protein n=1 Tax=Ustilago bromivora TaxID=307758 RepID=A0A1K0FWS9_9BASI|nr:uncharacterized protein UBRO_20989 [Ustilago bromivora]